VLSARLVTLTVDRKGRTQKKSKKLVDKLMLTAEEAAVVVAPRSATHSWYTPISNMNLPRR
jgi:hypothetical protein